MKRFLQTKKHVHQCVFSNTEGLLSESEYRPFWVSWENHNVTVGRGNIVGQDTLLFVDEGVPEFNAVAYDTDGFIGHWKLQKDRGRLLFFFLSEGIKSWLSQLSCLEQVPQKLLFTCELCQKKLICMRHLSFSLSARVLRCLYVQR